VHPNSKAADAANKTTIPDMRVGLWRDILNFMFSLALSHIHEAGRPAVFNKQADLSLWI
jgi:hypothetical protein